MMSLFLCRTKTKSKADSYRLTRCRFPNYPHGSQRVCNPMQDLVVLDRATRCDSCTFNSNAKDEAGTGSARAEMCASLPINSWQIILAKQSQGIKAHSRLGQKRLAVSVLLGDLSRLDKVDQQLAKSRPPATMARTMSKCSRTGGSPPADTMLIVC